MKHLQGVSKSSGKAYNFWACARDRSEQCFRWILDGGKAVEWLNLNDVRRSPGALEHLPDHIGAVSDASERSSADWVLGRTSQGSD